MNETFLTCLNQMGVMLLLMGVGFLLYRSKALPDSAGAVISNLITAVFMPALIFNTMRQNVSVKTISAEYPILLLGLGLLVCSFLLAKLYNRIAGGSRDEQDAALYNITVPNYGYFGYSLMAALLSSRQFFEFMLLGLPTTVYVYVYEPMLFRGLKQPKLKDVLLHPCILAVLVGILAGLTALPLPSFLDTALTNTASGMGPLAMLLTGYVLGRSKLSLMLKSGRAYLLTALRLIVIPLCIGLLLRLFGFPQQTVLMAVAMTAMPAGLGGISFSESYGRDSTCSARLCFLSSVLGLVTIPFVLLLFS